MGNRTQPGWRGYTAPPELGVVHEAVEDGSFLDHLNDLAASAADRLAALRAAGEAEPDDSEVAGDDDEVAGDDDEVVRDDDLEPERDAPPGADGADGVGGAVNGDVVVTVDAADVRVGVAVGDLARSAGFPRRSSSSGSLRL